jgi:aquaporin Z
MERALNSEAIGAPRRALAAHWPEYLIEAAGLGLFMLSATAFTALLEYPGSWVHQSIDNGTLRRVLIGLAMGLTAIAIIYSPWGKRSGAHINPAATFTFYRLGKIAPWDAFFYIGAQFLGATLGMVAALLALTPAIVAHPSVNFVVTVPGMAGIAVAFIAETAISFGLMMLVLVVSNRREWNRYTGLLAGLLVMVYIGVEAPLSGMSMNPARSFGSALLAQDWHGFAVYLTAPLLGMLIAAQVYLNLPRANRVLCCKLHHENNENCIFHCQYHGDR